MSKFKGLVAGLLAGALAGVVSVAAAGSAVADEPAGTFVTAGKSAVPGEYVVVLRDGARMPKLPANARVFATYRAAIKGAAVRGLTPAQARKLAKSSAVEQISENAVVKAATTQPSPPSWGLDRIDQVNLPLNNAYSYTRTGYGVRAYVIDTGILTTHSEFTGRASWGFTAPGTGGGNVDCNGHGTHVAGTVGGARVGVAKGVRLVAVKVLDCGGSGTLAGVIAGVDWVTINAVKPAVANMSLGCACGTATNALDLAVQNSIERGITYTLAAGNNGADTAGFSPAHVLSGVTVGATDAADNRAGFSNWGPIVDVYAPGVNIRSTWISSPWYANLNGTSMAAPHAAGVAARVLQAVPSWQPNQVAVYLRSTGGKWIVAPGAARRLLYAPPAL